jgi:hypothetical protein
MPSGFQNDSNQLQAEMYRVVVTMSNATYYPTTGGAENDRGGVTPTSSDSFSTANAPTTLAKGQNRARGNMRFRNVVNRLTGLTDCQIRDITITEANADAQATSLSFTVAYERPSFIPVEGTAIDGSTAITTTAIAIQNAVAQGVRDATTAAVRVFDPTVGSGDSQLSISVTASGATAAQTFGTVGVTLIDESTLFN